jgi:hypothetical protein
VIQPGSRVALFLVEHVVTRILLSAAKQRERLDDSGFTSPIALNINDKADKLLEGIVGKRLTYQTTQG